MKTKILLIASLLLTGCTTGSVLVSETTTFYKDSKITHIVKRESAFKIHRTLTDVSLVIDFEKRKAGYSSDVNSAAIKSIAEGTVKGLIKGVKP